eukprot:3330735-Rhodomonas_salina.2
MSSYNFRCSSDPAPLSSAQPSCTSTLSLAAPSLDPSSAVRAAPALQIRSRASWLCAAAAYSGSCSASVAQRRCSTSGRIRQRTAPARCSRRSTALMSSHACAGAK